MVYMVFPICSISLSICSGIIIYILYHCHRKEMIYFNQMFSREAINKILSESQ